MRDPRRISKITTYIILSPILAFFIAPILWLLVTPFSSRPSLFISFSTPTLENFVKVFQNKTAVTAFKNSVIISVGVVLLVTTCALFASYVLSRHYFRGRDILLYVLVLFSSIVTGVAAMVPIFILNLRFGLIDKELGVILTMTGGMLPTSIFILKDFFDSIPRTFEEAALVDGSSPLQVMFRIFLPLSSKGIIVIAMLVFAQSWSNFLIPFILLRSHTKYPVSIAIYTFFTEIGVPDIGMISAYALLYTTPVIVTYFLIERKFGFSFYGGIKG
ncbi:carbohydrate ABC transporter permease [Pseudothermotoga sp. U03pept]|uniref:carbohydrate ABC transporter permease n=1 Tax=Pseudothermotoga sp. U03pept TaxID=3447012 RepID=UPI003EFBB690